MKFIKIDNIWDERKKSLLDNENFFTISCSLDKQIINTKWWSLLDDNEEILGYGWFSYHDDCLDACEISIIVDKSKRGNKYGQKILEYLQKEATCLGYQSVEAIVKYSNNNRMIVVSWLIKNEFEPRPNNWTESDIEKAFQKELDVMFQKKLLLRESVVDKDG
jgi:L-amino acid N-acyltransferase YncA